MRSACVLVLAAVLVSSPVSAGERDPWKHLFDGDPASAAAPTVHVDLRLADPADAGAAPAAFALAAASTFAPGEPSPFAIVDPRAQTAAPAPAFEYSDAYRTRAKIHKVASFATLPLFATEVVLGQKTYDDPSGGTKSAHVAIGATIGALFAVNTVTGVWNLIESRKDPNGRSRRLVHGILMLAADAGFFATAAVAPDAEHADFADQRGTHRAVALTSIGIATAGYLVQIIGR